MVTAVHPHSKWGKRIILALVLLALVILNAALWMWARSGYVPEIDKPTLNLADSLLEEHSRGGAQVWDATVNVTKVTRPEGKAIYWYSMTASIVSANGTRILPRISLMRDLGDYDDAAPISVEVWYINDVAWGSNVDQGDAIKITGMSLEYEGAVLELYLDDDRIASTTLPMEFH